MSRSENIIVQCLLKSRRDALIGAVLCCSAAFVLIMATLVVQDKPNTGLLILSGLLLLLGIYQLYSARRKLRPDCNKVLDQLRHRKREIVWVYSYRIVSMPFGVHLFNMAGIYMHDRHGRSMLLRVPDSKLMELMEALNSDLPHATFGHSAKKEQLYRVNPDLLYND